MKIDTRYTSIWDELPSKTKSQRKIPETLQEAQEFYQAAQSSVHKSLMQTWDSHNETMQESSKLRTIYHRKQEIEIQAQKRREKQTEYLKSTSL